MEIPHEYILCDDAWFAFWSYIQLMSPNLVSNSSDKSDNKS